MVKRDYIYLILLAVVIIYFWTDKRAQQQRFERTYEQVEAQQEELVQSLRDSIRFRESVAQRQQTTIDSLMNREPQIIRSIKYIRDEKKNYTKRVLSADERELDSIIRAAAN